MTRSQYLNEPVLVDVRIAHDGTVVPTAFVWRERILRIADRGREWQEEEDGVAWHCYLVRTAGNETFELRYAPAEGRWLLARAWMAPRLV